MKSFNIILYLLLICLPTFLFGQGDEIENHLQKCYNYYESANKEEIKSLVDLDDSIRAVIKSIWTIPADSQHWTRNADLVNKYQSLGLYSAYWGSIQYDGRFLKKAHQINPNSIYREVTMFTEVCSAGTKFRLGEMPSIEKAYRYEEEFTDVYLFTERGFASLQVHQSGQFVFF